MKLSSAQRFIINQHAKSQGLNPAEETEEVLEYLSYEPCDEKRKELLAREIMQRQRDLVRHHREGIILWLTVLSVGLGAVSLVMA